MMAGHTRFYHLPLAVIIMVIVNALLFAGLPLLTRGQERRESKPYENPILIAHLKPPKPPEEPKERELKERKLKQMQKKHTRRSKARPKMEVSQFEFAADMGGGAGIGMKVGSVDEIPEFKKEMQKIEFVLSEVDTPPRVIRKAPPVYPFGAKRKGIQGGVLILCLIKIDGEASRYKILESRPPGVFDETALNAVKKWRFKPGILGGEPVPTWVRIPLKFELH